MNQVDRIERNIALIIEAAVLAEREACAKVCDGLHNGRLEEAGSLVGEIYNDDCAAAIRARGEK